MNNTPTPSKSKIESAYKEMMEDVQMSGSMIAYCMKDKALDLERELTAVTEQRDRLAEALEEIMHHEYCCDREYAKTATIAIEALQSLNQPTKP